MKKIISLFQRNYDGDYLVRNEVVPNADWVIQGEGEATLKLDGECYLIEDNKLYRRHEVRQGKKRPIDFRPAQDPDRVTGHEVGWVPVHSSDSACKWAIEAIPTHDPSSCGMKDGTFELLGPKVQGNPYGLDKHVFFIHGHIPIEAPRTFDALREWFRDNEIEGIVWHHPDGRMVKIKRKDFGYPWPIPQEK